MDLNSNIEIFKKYFKKYYKKIFFYSKVFFILLIIVLIERYIIYNIIYFILYLLFEKIFPLLFIKNIFSLRFESIILAIFLHILLARLIILSIIFLQGGLFKKVLTCQNFGFFILLMNNYLESVDECAEKNNIDRVKYYMSKLNLFRQSYYNLKSKNISFIIEDYTFESELNEMFSKYDEYICNINQETLKAFMDSIKDFLNKINKYRGLSLFQQLFTFKYTESLIMLEEYMMNNYETHIVEKKNIGKNFEIYILSPKEANNDNKILSIYCNQNALCSECYAISHDNIELYLYELNCTVILWNYSGFGLRKGLTTFKKIDKDVDMLSNFIQNNFSDYKIIIHGCSIGGYSSIKLAGQLNNLKNVVLIADRTYGDIDNIALSLSLEYGKILSTLYNIIFPKIFYHSGNVDNYISVPAGRKLICYDLNDEIIHYNPSSLVFNLTKKYYNDIIKPKIEKYKEYKKLIENPKEISAELRELSLVLNDEKYDKNALIFIQHFNKYINSIEKFFMYFVVFGFPFNIFKEIDYDIEIFKKTYLEVPIIFRNFIKKHKNSFSTKLIELLQIFNFLFVKLNLKTNINDNDLIKMNYEENNNGLFQLNDSLNKEIHKYFGYVHRINCGHNGKLKLYNINYIKGFLLKNQIHSD